MDGCIKAVMVFEDGSTSKFYDQICKFKDGFAKVKLDGKYGIIDRDGCEIIPPVYDLIYDFYDDLAVVILDEKRGLVSSNGDVIVEPKYDVICRFTGEIAKVILNGKCGIINRKGEELLKPEKYNDISEFSNGIAKVFVYSEDDSRYSGTYGLVDESLHEIVNPKYHYMGEFVDGVAIVSINDYYGLIDKFGNEIVIPEKYTGIGRFRDGIAQVRITIAYNFVDGDGISHTLSKYLYGLINTKGEEIVEAKYHSIGRFDENGIARVVKESEYYEAHINIHGIEV